MNAFSQEHNSLQALLEQQGTPLFVPAKDGGLYVIARVGPNVVQAGTNALVSFLAGSDAAFSQAATLFQQLQPTAQVEDAMTPEDLSDGHEGPSEFPSVDTERVTANLRLGRLASTRKRKIGPKKNHYQKCKAALAQIPNSAWVRLQADGHVVDPGGIRTTDIENFIRLHERRRDTRIERRKEAIVWEMVQQDRSLDEIAERLKTTTKTARNLKRKVLKKASGPND